MKSKILALALLIIILAACGGTTPAAPASLEGTSWVLQTLRGQALVAGTTITLDFDSDEVGGTAGCNQYGGSYTVAGDQLTLGMLFMTEMYCMDPDGVMAQESDYLEALATVARYRMAGERLELLDSDGQVVLSFTPAPPAPAVALEGTAWVLTTFLDGDAARSVLNGTEITLLLEEGNVGGTAGCNSYTGSYTRQDDTLAFGPLATTRMYCQDPDGVMDQEAQYLDLLGNVTTFELDGAQLTLRAADGSGLVFRGR
jgi:heat shock protein HslJ